MLEETLSEETLSTSHVSVPASPRTAPDKPSDHIMSVSDKMVLLTWISFVVVATALHKLLWKPLLGTLEKRETDIKDALDGADRARDEIAEYAQKKHDMLSNAAKEARSRMDEALRDAAVLKEKANREAHEASAKRMKEAEAQIALERANSEAAVRTATIAQIGGLLEHVLSQELSAEQKSKYQNAMIREVEP